MTAQYRDMYLRNYVMGVLVSYQEKGINTACIGDLATDLTKAFIEAEESWQELRRQKELESEPEPLSNCCFAHTIGGGTCEYAKDIPQ